MGFKESCRRKLYAERLFLERETPEADTWTAVSRLTQTRRAFFGARPHALTNELTVFSMELRRSKD